MNHEFLEKNLGWLVVAIVIAISFGGLTQIVPLAFQEQMVEPIEGLEPLNAVQLEGRDIYIREGCHVCHTQMIRALRSETARYGHYSVAGEHVYERPFLWGSKRNGPDLAPVGGRYPDETHLRPLYNHPVVAPYSTMRSYH